MLAIIVDTRGRALLIVLETYSTYHNTELLVNLPSVPIRPLLTESCLVCCVQLAITSCTLRLAGIPSTTSHYRQQQQQQVDYLLVHTTSTTGSTAHNCADTESENFLPENKSSCFLNCSIFGSSPRSELPRCLLYIVVLNSGTWCS